MKFALVVLIPFLVCSCGSLVDKVHQQISQEENGQGDATNPYPSQAYGKLKTKKNDRMSIKDPITYALTGDDTNQNISKTPLKVQKRFTAGDFVDSDPSASLWSNYDDSSSLFSTGNARKTGAIVVIDVLESMKNSISKELRKVYPLIPLFQPNPIVATLAEDDKGDTKDENSKAKDATRAPATAATDAAKEDTEIADIIYDKISTRVSEEVSKEYVLVKGRKEVYFRNKKRLIEIHGLAKKTDIDATDRIKSDQLVESKIFIVQ